MRERILKGEHLYDILKPDGVLKGLGVSEQSTFEGVRGG
jgi:hypothetical protein